MKVLHIITRMNTGGPAVFLDHLTKSMAVLGTKSTIAYGYCESNETDYLDTHQLKADLVKVKSLHRSLNPFDDIKAFVQIRKIIKTLEPDVINTHTFKAGVLGRIAARTVLPAPIIIHTYLGHLIYGYFSHTKIWLYTTIEKILTNFTSTAIAVTAETMKSLKSRGVGLKLNWKIIHLGIPVSKLSNNKMSPGEKLSILWVGRFTDIKDPIFAVETIRELSQKKPGKFELTMVGGGELFEKVSKLGSDLPIRFCGVVKDPFKKFRNFDLLMMTSKNEGLPLVILEAANCYRATISTDVGGISEFVQDNSNGYLIARDISMMANKIMYLAENKKVLRQFGLNAKQLLKTSFSDKQMAQLHFELYRSLIIRI